MKLKIWVIIKKNIKLLIKNSIQLKFNQIIPCY